MRSKPYPKNMLPGIDYRLLDDFLYISITELEYQTMVSLSDIVKGLEIIMQKNKMIQTPETMALHLCGYLGFLTVRILGIKEANTLLNDINELLSKQTKSYYKLFLKYPIYSPNLSKEEKSNNLELLRKNSPGSISVQTIRLGSQIFDMMQNLQVYSEYNVPSVTLKNENALICPIESLLPLFLTSTKSNIREWKGDLPLIYYINQTIMQLAQLMAYFAYLGCQTSKNYLEFGLNSIELFIEYGHKFIKKTKGKGDPYKLFNNS